MSKIINLSACLTILLISCSKNSNSVQTPIPSVKTDVYIAGKVGIGSASQAVYWKNDSMVGLTGPNTNANANAITVTGNDVYVAGSIGSTIGYWKNGNFNELSDTNSLSNGGIAYKGYIYIPTSNTTNAVKSAQYYRNSELITVPQNSMSSTLTGIAVRGIDVYTSGNFFNSAGKSVAAYWQNNTLVKLTDGTRNAYTSSILLTDADIYVSGSEEEESGTHMIAKYWKNGAPVILSDSSAVQITTGLAVSGSNIYVSGYQKTGTIGTAGTLQAKYWKNDTSFSIATSGVSSLATSVAAQGFNFYVVYQDEIMTNNSTASYIFNGQPISLKDGSNPATANSIFVNVQ